MISSSFADELFGKLFVKFGPLDFARILPSYQYRLPFSHRSRDFSKLRIPVSALGQVATVDTSANQSLQQTLDPVATLSADQARASVNRCYEPRQIGSSMLSNSSNLCRTRCTWIAFVVWASFVVNRANPSSVAERLLWYIVILSMPIVGSLLELVRYLGAVGASVCDARMQSELQGAYAETVFEGRGLRV